MPNPLIRTLSFAAIISTSSVFGGEAQGARACRADELTRVSDRWEYVEADGYHVGYMTISALVSCRIRAEDMVYTLYLDGKKITDPADFYPAGMRPRGIVWYLIRECSDPKKLSRKRDLACVAVKVDRGVLIHKNKESGAWKFTFEILDLAENRVRLQMENAPHVVGK